MSQTTASQLRATTPIIIAQQPSQDSNLPISPAWKPPSREEYLHLILPNDMYPNVADNILSLKYSNSNKYVFDTNNFETVLEIINLFVNPKYSEYNLQTKLGILVAISHNPNEDMVWSMPSSSSVIQQYEYEYKLSTEKLTGTAYRGKCRNRGCANIDLYDSVNIQTRSADEPESQFIICLVCKTGWRQG